MHAVHLKSRRFVIDPNTNVANPHRPWQRKSINVIRAEFDPSVFVEYFFASSVRSQIGNLDIVDSEVRCFPAGPFDSYLSYRSIVRAAAQGLEPGAVPSGRRAQQDLRRVSILSGACGKVIWDAANLQPG